MISYLLIRRKSPQLEKFIIEKCTKNIVLFLKCFDGYLDGLAHELEINQLINILWYLKAYGQSERGNKKSMSYVDGLICKAERAMVNGTLFPEEAYLTIKEDKLHKFIINETERKKLRSEYLTETLKFTDILVTLSFKLKAYKIEERNLICKSYMNRVNKWLAKLRKKHANDKNLRNLFKGIQMPFNNILNHEIDNSNTIVQIIENEVGCFNTKKRVPYKIVVETVDMNDFDKFQPKIVENDIKSPDETQSQMDDWNDIAMEREALIDEAHAKTVMSLRENYGVLANFNKLAQEEAKKIKDQNLLKVIDLAEKLQDIQKVRAAQPLKIVNFANGLEKKSMHIEEHKDNHLLKNSFHSPLKKKKLLFNVAVKIIHDPNLHRFTKTFPKDKNLSRRKSVEYKIKSDIPSATRRNSLSKITTANALKCLKMMHHSYADKINMDKIDRIIKDLSNEITLSTKIQHNQQSPEKKEITKLGPWEELWYYKKKSIQEKSIYGHFPSYKLRCLIVKGDDDLRQELICMQLIKKIQNIWKEAGLTLQLRPYDIIVTSEDSGIIEFIPDTFSIDGLKKKVQKSLLEFYVDVFDNYFEEAQKNFIDSLAAYSLICYLLQIKDRHNGNILIDAHGHIIHIDFGFIFSNSPGSINFESAPFKLTQEYVELMNGLDSDMFVYFKLQLLKGFLEIRKHVESLVYLLQIMMDGSDLSCFENFDMYSFQERFKFKLTDRECMEFIEDLVENSYDNWRTVQYDNFQKMTNDIMP